MRLGLGLGFGRSGNGSGYYILLGGVYGGAFNETTGAIGPLDTATTNLPGTIAWSIEAGGDADISINSSSGVVSSARAIYAGDDADFTVIADNGTIAIGFPFTATGTVSVDISWILSGAMIDVDYENDRAYLYGVGYPSVAAARTAGVIVQTSSIDRIALTGLASIYTFAAKGTTHSVTAVGNTARYIASLDDATVNNLVYFGQFDDAGTAKLRHSVVAAGTDNTGGLLKTATSAGTSSAVRYAARVALNDVAVSFGGAAVMTDASVAFPTVTQIVVADRHDATRPWLGTVKRVAVVNATTSNANLPNILA